MVKTLFIECREPQIQQYRHSDSSHTQTNIILMLLENTIDKETTQLAHTFK